MANDVLFIVCLLVQNFVFTSSVTSTDDTKCQCDEGKINRDDFPEGFLFGAATSAYQVLFVKKFRIYIKSKI